MLANEIEKLNNEIAKMEQQLCSGSLAVEQLTQISISLPKKKDELDEKRNALVRTF